MADHSRDPWYLLPPTLPMKWDADILKFSPWVILNDFGGAFSMVCSTLLKAHDREL